MAYEIGMYFYIDPVWKVSGSGLFLRVGSVPNQDQVRGTGLECP
jgi:hypothetical protein